MARGSIVWGCRVCGTRKTRGACKHGGGYSIIHPVERWDPKQERFIKSQKWEIEAGKSGSGKEREGTSFDARTK